jgi:ATP-dependent DNA helicase HFM1/MER3
LKSLAELPQYQVKITELSTKADGGKSPVRVELRVACGLVTNNKSIGYKSRDRGFDMSFVLTVTSDLELLDFRRIPYVLACKVL